MSRSPRTSNRKKPGATLPPCRRPIAIRFMARADHKQIAGPIDPSMARARRLHDDIAGFHVDDGTVHASRALIIFRTRGPDPHSFRTRNG